MNAGNTVFSQLMSLIPDYELRKWKQLRDYRFKGKLSYTRVGDKYWYTQDDIDEFMAKHHRKAFA